MTWEARRVIPETAVVVAAVAVMLVAPSLAVVLFFGCRWESVTVFFIGITSAEEGTMHEQALGTDLRA